MAIHFKTLEKQIENDKANEKETALFALEKEMESKMIIIE